MGFEKQDLLLMVWVHGFKGDEVTFESFPDRVSHLLQATHPKLRVESHVFPAYQTRGELTAATLAFVDWLTTLVVNLEVDHGAGGGAGKAKVVLMGHSMGGLLIADAALDIAKNTRKGDPMWPRIVAIIAYDTPYLGLHPHVFKHGISTAASYYETARNVASNVAMLSPLAVGLRIGKFGNGNAAAGPSGNGSEKGKERAPEAQAEGAKSWWGGGSAKALYGFGAVALGAAAAGTAYYRREDFLSGWKWGYDHMTFVKNLWEADAMRERLEKLDDLSRERNIRFSNYYTHLPPAPPTNLLARTFAILPATAAHPTSSHWRPATNQLNTDEVRAHMGMFNPRTNDGFYDMGLTVVREVGERVQEEGVKASTETHESEKMVEDGKDGEEEWRMNEIKKDWMEEKDEKGRSVWVET